jgi:hypothetical protein
MAFHEVSAVVAASSFNLLPPENGAEKDNPEQKVETKS